MPKATWKDVVLAESDHCQVVEGNQYFPPESIRKQYFQEIPTTTTCPWKGPANYYTIVVNGQENRDAAWYYPAPKEAASNIQGHVAFWKGVRVEK